jgi:DNA-binding response OmpR family regulator
MAAKILIVDDEPFTVDLLQTYLQIHGYETLSAFNGEDGLVMAKVENPDAMVLDLMMPDIEGYEVCARLRAFPQTTDLPILILSARVEQASKDRAMKAGANGYLTKPVVFSLLLSELKRVIEQRQIKTNKPPITNTSTSTSTPTSSTTSTT